jgi:hypothetical protein
MVAFTASQELPYAEDTDRVCDSPEILQLLAETVEARLGDLEDVHDSLDLRPAVKMYTSPQPTLVPFTFVSFDHVDFDTANLVDLNLDDLAITAPIPEAGTTAVWLHGTYFSVTGAGSNTDLAGATVYATLGTSQASGQQRDKASFNKGHVVDIFNDFGAGATMVMSITPSNAAPPATVNLDICEQYAFRIGFTS